MFFHKYCFDLSLKASPRNVIAQRPADRKLIYPVLKIMDYMENGKYHSDKGNMYLKSRIKLIYRMLASRRIINAGKLVWNTHIAAFSRKNSEFRIQDSEYLKSKY